MKSFGGSESYMTSVFIRNRENLEIDSQTENAT